MYTRNLESVEIYGSTDEVHTLVLGQSLTGIPVAVSVSDSTFEPRDANGKLP